MRASTLRQRYHGLAKALPAALLVAWWVVRRPFPVEVSGASMRPTLEPGEYLVAVRRRPRPGDLVVVEHPARPGYEMVKRAIRIDDEGHWWVEGDDPAMSTDSRHFGTVRGDAIRGVVVVRYWPARRFALLRPLPFR